MLINIFNFLLIISLLAANSLQAAESGRLDPPDQGLADYLAGLALEYRTDEEPDYQGAFALYQSAAKSGSREAALALARLSEPGGQQGQTPEQWRDYLAAASKAGWPEAAFTLAQGLEQGLFNSGGLQPGDYYFQAALAGHPQAAGRLGELYLQDGSPERDESLGAMWLAVAVGNHNAEAALTLGRLYCHKNPSVARHWLEKATAPEASYLLGRLYLDDKRFVEAVSAFTVAADQNYAPAHLALGLINLDNDFGLRPKVREALKHFKAAAQAGLPEGAYRLGHMYLAGQATPKDTLTGAFWLYRAGSGGHREAMSEYEKISRNFSVGQKKRLERMIAEELSESGHPLESLSGDK